MMTRLILPFLVAFLAAIAGGSALVLVKARDAHAKALADLASKKAKADSTHGADSSHHGGADSTHHGEADSAGHGRADSAARGNADSAGHGGTAGTKPPTAHAPAAAPTPTSVTVPANGKPGPVGPASETGTRAGGKGPPALTAEGKVAVSGAEAALAIGAEKKLAKIFGSMSPRDAAKVLQQMEDADVRVILGHLGSKQAAAVLGNFPAQRAAELSRQSLKAPTMQGH